MGSAAYIVLERKIPGLETFVAGKALARESAKLDQIARDLGRRPLTEFFSLAPEDLADVLEEEADLPETIDGSPLGQQWFDTPEGLDTVRALIAHLQAAPEPADETNTILKDLQDMERILDAATTAGIRWHLAIDI